jgi:hypothetical protein
MGCIFCGEIGPRKGGAKGVGDVKEDRINMLLKGLGYGINKIKSVLCECTRINFELLNALLLTKENEAFFACHHENTC